MTNQKYPYYRDNPHLSLKVVRDVRGNLEYLANCRKFDDIFYVKNVDLDYVDDRWVKKPCNIYDYELKKYVSTEIGMIQGIVNINSNGSVVAGWFTPNPYTNCTITDRYKSRYTFIDYKLLPPDLYREKINEGIYYKVDGDSTRSFYETRKLFVTHENAPYNIEDNNYDFERKKLLYAESVFPIDRDIRFAAKYIGSLTFGAEVETINGCVPKHILNTFGTVVCKDGSIKASNGAYPPEYVTVPLSGAKGIQNLRNISKEISKRSDIDIKCSYHLHIGGVKPDRLYIISLYRLCMKIQNDVFKMFPHYKLKPEGIKEKNYCKQLPNVIVPYDGGNFNKYLNDTFIDLYSFLSGGIKPSSDFNRRTRQNPWGGGKWNIRTRYYWVNFVNLLFHKRETVEFRLHTPTTNSDKMISWLFICSAIIQYAQNNIQKCIGTETISFIDVLSMYRDTYDTKYAKMLSTNLIDYYTDRVSLFENDIKRGDYISEHDIKLDSSFQNNILNIK